MIISLIIGYGLLALVSANVFGGLVTIIIKVIIIKTKIPINLNLKFKSKRMIKELFSYSFYHLLFP